MARGRCESRPRRRPFAGKTERSLEGAFLLPLTDEAQTDARAARLELERLLAGRPFELPTGFADAAERYVALLLEANRRLNLTRVVEPADVARLHLLDALSALPLIDALPDARRAWRNAAGMEGAADRRRAARRSGGIRHVRRRPALGPGAGIRRARRAPLRDDHQGGRDAGA